eukprot:CAMPEP_0197179666 /NCGR_PEP_ID=MMETSP1423-20130617/4537_1 /TAXON_ID=476441 /ORGANISM="Pseudo-nitzschia heimii, Strain UNC1101" /LENGTH=80 /DNA_ID=CAMNT_0042629605 /DNA_START=51 /DNA_END=293 /DNA_ORIENTATION=+
MKSPVSALLLLPALTAAFAPNHKVIRSTSSLSAAKSFEEDLELTRAVIASFNGDLDESEPTEVAVDEIPEAEQTKEEEAE